MRFIPQELSARGFLFYVALVLVGLLAFPIWQIIETGGFLFYSNGMDEASHLSYSYAEYSANRSGRMRYSSYLVVALHSLGIGGGYINLFFDAVCTTVILVLATRTFQRFGYSPSQARSGALLCFLFPLLFTPFNPVVSLLASFHFDPQIIKWISMPWNPEIPFIRSPEPQLSWLVIVAALSVTAGSRFVPLALLAVSPLVYPFVRLPLIFVGLSLLASKRMALPLAALVSFVACGVLMGGFLHLATDPITARMFIFSRLPLIPFTGVLALALYLIIKDYAPKSHRALLVSLVCSIWAVGNVQLISGYLVTPVNFENYWGVVVLAFLSTIGILYRSDDQRGWVGFALLLFGVFSAATFAFNQGVSSRLNKPAEVLPLLAHNSAGVACNDLYLTTYLDLVHPKQEPTMFSWTRTLDLTTDRYYQQYQCDKKLLESLSPSDKPLFDPLFAAVDAGFVSRGADIFMSLGRQPRPIFTGSEPLTFRPCESRDLVVTVAR